MNFLSADKRGRKEPDILTSSDGTPMFATGNCNDNLDCFPSGCSKHVCANHEVETSCEEIDFPTQEAQTCGCINSRCVWFQ